MSSQQLLDPPPPLFEHPIFEHPIFKQLARSRELLAASPLIPSLELALIPMSEAAEMLGAPDLSLTNQERERLASELGGVRQLLEGVGQWLASRGALTPTYNRHAELDVSPWDVSLLAGIPAAASPEATGVSMRGNLSVEG